METKSQAGIRSMANMNSFEELCQAVRKYGVEDVVSASSMGLSSALLASMADHYEISLAEVGPLLGLPKFEATFAATDNVKLSLQASEQLVRIAQLEIEAVDVFGEVQAMRWLKASNTALGQKSPLEALAEYNAGDVLRLLSAIRHGGAA